MDTSTVFSLRKSGKLAEALKLALELYSVHPWDEWVQKALAWTLIDNCKKALVDKDLNQAQIFFKQLTNIAFGDIDEILNGQINFLKPKVDIHYSKIQQAENLSKGGSHKEALTLMLSMISNKELFEIHHEAYGWVIYRYVKAEEKNIPSIEIRSLLRDYMNLKNEKPSLLHSMFLNFALHFSKEHSDFNLYNFFLLWDPNKLRIEDIQENIKDEKTFPSLISRIYREFIDKKYPIDINLLIQKTVNSAANFVLLSKIQVLDLFREPFYWNIYNADKENKRNEVWTLFDDYNKLLKNQPGSDWHSKILTSAVFKMSENEEWRFLPFFQNWNPETLRTEDWKEEKKEDKVFKSLGVKALNKIYEIVRAGKKVENLTTFLNSYDIAIAKYPKDNWLKREKAILLIKNGNKEQAVKIYTELIFELGDQAYIWHEFSKCMDDSLPEVASGMLCKAISIQKNEDFLGEIHLDLAQLLVNQDLLEDAYLELDLYKLNRDSNGWKLSDTYSNLFQKVKDVKIVNKDRNSFYSEKSKIAEEFAYQGIQWVEVVLIDKWKNDKSREKLSFSDGKEIDFSVSQSRFPELRNANLGQIFCFKLHKAIIQTDVDKGGFYFSPSPVQYTFIPLLVQKSSKPNWSILTEIYAVVDYINLDKRIIHAITFDNKEVFFSDDKSTFKNRDFIKARFFKKKIKNEIRYELRDINKIEGNIALEKLPKILAIVDGVNNEKKLFHFVVNSRIHGVIKFEETELRPNEGDFIYVKLLEKNDKKYNKIIFKPLQAFQTDETTTSLRKEISGLLELKFKLNGRTVNFGDLDADENNILPDFGFIDDFYVPKYLLKKHNITSNCKITARALLNGEKWKIFELIHV